MSAYAWGSPVKFHHCRINQKKGIS